MRNLSAVGEESHHPEREISPSWLRNHTTLGEILILGEESDHLG